MLKTVVISLLLIVFSSNSWGEEEIYLEGISVLGDQKNAYISMKGGKISVSEGDSIGIWQVARIEERSVFLTTENGEATELPLHSRLPLPETETEEEPSPKPQPETEQSEADETTLEIPPGYRKVHTPFGDFLVKEEQATQITQTKPPAAAQKPVQAPEDLPTVETVPPGHRKVKTPFGEFLIEEESTTADN